MNLFLIGWCESGQVDSEEARATVSGLAHDLPFFDERSVQSWRAPSGRLAVACVGHELAETGDVAYTHFEADRFALFSGRPFVWTGEFEADGRMPLDPRFFLGDPDIWSEALDGRCVAARYDDATSTLDLYTDPLGTYHVFLAERDGTSWLSTNSEVLRRLTAARDVSPLALASLVAAGWSFGGRPPWEGISRIPPGLYRVRAEAPNVHRALLPTRSNALPFEDGFDAEASSRTLVGAVRALSNWPRRPTYLSLTGGLDSRLVFAAAERADMEFEPRIMVGSAAEPETSDVEVARAVAASLGCTLRVAASNPVATLEDAARALRLTTPGTYQLDFAWAALNRPDQGWWIEPRGTTPLPLVLTGHGGEVARRWWAIGNPANRAEATRRLYRRCILVWPRTVVSREGQHLLHTYIDDWVSTHHEAGVALDQLSDVFFLLERSANGTAVLAAFDEYMSDLIAPLWSRRLLPSELGLPAGDRARDLFHFYTLEALAPELTRMPFAGPDPEWPTFGRSRPVRAKKLRTVAARVRQELARRYRYVAHRGPPMLGDRMLGDGERLALERALGRPKNDDVWHVLDRRKTIRLLTRDPRGLDVRSRRNAWRVVTVFLSSID